MEGLIMTKRKIISNYRKYYKKYYNIPTGFIVHHIDNNRDNNLIDNLIAIPRKLHVNYHINRARAKFLLDYLDFNSYRWGCVPNDEFLLSFKKVNEYLKEIEKFINSKHLTKVF
jgi:hypothetical protein